MTTSLASLELELRRLPGVVGVGITAHDETTVVHLLAPDVDGLEEVRRRAALLGKLHVEGPVSIEIDDGHGTVAPSADVRVRLLAVRHDPDDHEVEVHITHGEARTVGCGPGDALRGAAEAVLDALAKLGAHVPYTVGEVVAIGQAGVQTVLVEMQPKSKSNLDVRHGAADGHSLDEAAARATLHALNRWLGGPGGLSGGS